jgi:hypothetical protein
MEGKFSELDPYQIICLSEGRKYFGYGPTQIDEKIKSGEIPAPIALSDTGRQGVDWTPDHRPSPPPSAARSKSIEGPSPPRGRAMTVPSQHRPAYLPSHIKRRPSTTEIEGFALLDILAAMQPLCHRGSAMIHVLPDTSPDMWRGADTHGRVSDLANYRDTQETSAAAPPIAGSNPAATWQAPAAARSSEASAADSCRSIYKAARQ